MSDIKDIKMLEVEKKAESLKLASDNLTEVVDLIDEEMQAINKKYRAKLRKLLQIVNGGNMDAATDLGRLA